MSKQDIYNEALTNVDRLGVYLNELIDKHGEVKAVKKHFSGDKQLIDVYHDYIYYCFTKSSRSIYSSFVLAKENLREDALIILRTVYENYLRLSYTLKEPMKINEFVFQEIGLKTGAFIYKTESTGRKIYSKVINLKNSKEFYHGTKVSIMAGNSINPVDNDIHKILYQYLSEHTHPNMIASGNYRSKNNENYVLFRTSLHLELPFFINYLCFILIDAIYYYHTNLSDWNIEGITIEEASELEFIRDHTKEILIGLINTLGFIEFDENFKIKILKRIN